MADKPSPFVINDRRKFTAEGEIRSDYVPSKPAAEAKAQTQPEAQAEGPAETKSGGETIAFPKAAEPSRSESEAEPSKQLAAEPIAFPGSKQTAAPEPAAEEEFLDENIPPAPTAEQSAQAARAYAATVDRLDTAIRATNPGMERTPEMTFERFIQSLYMQAMIQLGGAAEPGETPRVDIIGARQTVDMLGLLSEKTKGNLSKTEDNLLQTALFEARMGFLEITQALARQNAGRQPGGAPGGPGGFGGPGGMGGPSIVR